MDCQEEYCILSQDATRCCRQDARPRSNSRCDAGTRLTHQHAQGVVGSRPCSTAAAAALRSDDWETSQDIAHDTAAQARYGKGNVKPNTIRSTHGKASSHHEAPRGPRAAKDTTAPTGNATLTHVPTPRTADRQGPVPPRNIAALAAHSPYRGSTTTAPFNSALCSRCFRLLRLLHC